MPGFWTAALSGPTGQGFRVFAAIEVYAEASNMALCLAIGRTFLLRKRAIPAQGLMPANAQLSWIGQGVRDTGLQLESLFPGPSTSLNCSLWSEAFVCLSLLRIAERDIFVRTDLQFDGS